MLINPYIFSSYTPTDTDAAAYIAAVEAADGSTLEGNVRKAIDNFVIGCKSDGIWSAIKASCILAGARTLSGALVPLVGPSPTSYNFVAADYNRKTGLKGNGSSKYIDTNWLSTNDLQDNNHGCIYVGQATATNIYNYYIGQVSVVNKYIASLSNNSFQVYWGFATGGRTIANAGNTTGFKGAARTASNAFTMRTNNTTFSYANISTTNTAENMLIFRHGASSFASAGISFYSFGSSLTLQLLDSRVSTLMNAFASAIP